KLGSTLPERPERFSLVSANEKAPTEQRKSSALVKSSEAVKSGSGIALGRQYHSDEPGHALHWPHKPFRPRALHQRPALRHTLDPTEPEPRRAGRGAPLLSHAQRLTRRRLSSQQVPPEPEQADFRPGKWPQERTGGDVRDPRHPPETGMGSRHRRCLGRHHPTPSLAQQSKWPTDVGFDHPDVAVWDTPTFCTHGDVFLLPSRI
ncbi:uncharacterized protein LOC108491743, partial [Nannospalax galili]|uniref:uncharacterized protein LOC108491743 n=1 Tax=Nannospalax galili TaxID=1026970 RepID=UPI000819EB77